MRPRKNRSPTQKRNKLEYFVEQLDGIAPLPTLTSDPYCQASDLIEELLHIVERLAVKDLPSGEFLIKAVMRLRKIGDPSAAETVARRSALLLKKIGEGADASLLLSQAGLSCADQCLFDEAGGYFEKALSLIEHSDPYFLQSSVLSNYANALTELEQFDRAEVLYRKALKALENVDRGRFRKARGMRREAVAGAVRNNLGWSYLRRARKSSHDKTCIARAMEVFEHALQTELLPRTRIIANSNLAELYLINDETDKAEKLLVFLEEDCSDKNLKRLLPEVYRRNAQLWAARQDVKRALLWSKKALRSSLLFINVRQELRVAEVLLDILEDQMAREGRRLSTLEGSGALIITELLNLLRNKDWYTGSDHSRRVAGMCKRLADSFRGKAKVDATWMKQVELAGLLHDIGKLVIPWSLLNRIRPLTPRDTEQLHKHAVAGKQILEKVGVPVLAEIVGDHHERMDGRGYPKGKKEVSLAGSIVAVSDAYEAMTSESRKYRSPKLPAAAVKEVMSAAGSQFDPEVARALSEVVD